MPDTFVSPGRPLRNGELVDRLCAVSPTLREARTRHVALQGTLMPHVFMGDVLTWVGRCMGGGATGEGDELRSILDTLEEGMACGDRETRSVIAISFTSDARLETFFSRLMPLLGTRMRTVLQKQG